MFIFIRKSRKKQEDEIPAQIINVPLGFTDCYLIQEDSVVMVDGGTEGNIDTFKTVIAMHNMQPSESN